MRERLAYLRAPPSLRGTGPKFTNSGRGAVIVVQHAAQALAPLDHACVSKMARFWVDESVGQPLVIALGVIQVSNRASILGNYETFFMNGIRGMVARCGCMQRW